MKSYNVNAKETNVSVPAIKVNKKYIDLTTKTLTGNNLRIRFNNSPIYRCLKFTTTIAQTTQTIGYSGRTSSYRTTASGYRTETSTTRSGSSYYSGYTATRLETAYPDGSGHNTAAGWYSRTMTSYTSKVSWSGRSAGAGGAVYSTTHYDTVINNYVDNRVTKTVTKTIYGSDYKPFDSNFISTKSGLSLVSGYKTSSDIGNLFSTTLLTSLGFISSTTEI